MSFVLSDQVTWTSQSQGYQKTKAGEIVEVVAPGAYPDRTRFIALYRGSGVGMPRDHESYVVQVGRQFYWPRANQLRRASSPAAEAPRSRSRP
jgi:hypothetical protein